MWKVAQIGGELAVNKNVLSPWAQMQLGNFLMIDWLWNVLALNINDIPYESPSPLNEFFRL